jgi:predicted house-cleaning noncanonical NTP pyrophosphatase (MazG superfamily)
MKRLLVLLGVILGCAIFPGCSKTAALEKKDEKKVTLADVARDVKTADDNSTARYGELKKEIGEVKVDVACINKEFGKDGRVVSIEQQLAALSKPTSPSPPVTPATPPAPVLSALEAANKQGEELVKTFETVNRLFELSDKLRGRDPDRDALLRQELSDFREEMRAQMGKLQSGQITAEQWRKDSAYHQERARKLQEALTIKREEQACEREGDLLQQIAELNKQRNLDQQNCEASLRRLAEAWRRTLELSRPVDYHIGRVECGPYYVWIRPHRVHCWPCWRR